MQEFSNFAKLCALKVELAMFTCKHFYDLWICVKIALYFTVAYVQRLSHSDASKRYTRICIKVEIK